jgi:hypothetical protein
MARFFEKHRSGTFLVVCSTVKAIFLILIKNGLGYILGDFFTNSSGHPARKFDSELNTRLIKYSSIPTVIDYSSRNPMTFSISYKKSFSNFNLLEISIIPDPMPRE